MFREGRRVKECKLLCLEREVVVTLIKTKFLTRSYPGTIKTTGMCVVLSKFVVEEGN